MCTSCDLRSALLACGIKVHLHSVLPITLLIHNIYRSEEVLDSNISDKDNSSDHCSDNDKAAESADKGSVIPVVIEMDNSRIVQDLQHSIEQYSKVMKYWLVDLQVHAALIASADPIPTAAPEPIPTAMHEHIPTTMHEHILTAVYEHILTAAYEHILTAMHKHILTSTPKLYGS